MTYKQLVSQYLNSVDFEKLGANSKIAYRTFLNNSLELALDITPGTNKILEAKHWFKKLTKMSVSNSTKNAYLAILKILYRFGEENELIDRSPICNLKKFVSNPDKQKPYTEEEVNLIFATAETLDEKIHANFFKAMFYTGCRPRELTSVCWNDVADGYINIRSAKRREIGTISRKCNIIKQVSECLTLCLEFHERKDNLEVFRSLRGCKICLTTLRAVIQELCRRSGVEYKQLRNTRSGLGTAMLKKGYSLYDVQHTLGHKSVTTTEKYYAKESLEDKAGRFKGL